MNLQFLYRKIDQKRFTFLSGLFSFGLYLSIMYIPKIVQPDLDEHIVISNTMWETMRLPAHPIFYVLIQLLSGFSKHLPAQLLAALIIFSVAQWAKIIVSAKIIKELFNYELNYLLALSLWAFQIFTNFSPFQDTFIKDQLSINYFHNGTLLVSMPFAFMVFLNAIQYFKFNEVKNLVNIVIWGLLTVLSKPSFIFCFIAAFPAYVMLVRGISFSFFRALLVSTILTVFIFSQSLYFKFFTPAYMNNIQILFEPFYLFGTLKHHFWVFINTSGLLILGFWTFNKEIRAIKEVRFGIAMLLTAYFIAFMFTDRINGILFNNMTWQVPIVLNIMYLFVIGIFSNPNVKVSPFKYLPFVCLFIAYFLYGLYYLYIAVNLRSFFF